MEDSVQAWNRGGHGGPPVQGFSLDAAAPKSGMTEFCGEGEKMSSGKKAGPERRATENRPIMMLCCWGFRGLS